MKPKKSKSSWANVELMLRGLDRLRGIEVLYLFSIDGSIELMLRFTFLAFLHLFLGAVFMSSIIPYV